MELILTKTIDTLGQEGELVNVKNGYGRNYLLPQGLAVMATKATIAQRDQNMAAIQARLDQERSGAEAMAKKLAGATVVIPMRVGEDDRLYGSVTSADLHERLQELGIEVDKRKIILEEPIKAIGVETVAYKAGYQVKAEFQVEVVDVNAKEKEAQEAAAPAESEAAPAEEAEAPEAAETPEAPESEEAATE
ncbi:MAG: 50S ribosomal protein L9 [Thermodesulfobacteriota bacterium]